MLISERNRQEERVPELVTQYSRQSSSLLPCLVKKVERYRPATPRSGFDNPFGTTSGCVVLFGASGGGGQPIPTSPAIRQARAQAIYAEDRANAIRKSHENPTAVKLSTEFFTYRPGGQVSIGPSESGG